MFRRLRKRLDDWRSSQVAKVERIVQAPVRWVGLDAPDYSRISDEMYEKFFGLTGKPFSTLPDPHFIYWGQKHSLCYATLEYGIVNQAGITVLTGEVGSGKTTLVRHLLDQIEEDMTVGVISNTQEGMGNLLEWVFLSFGLPFEGRSAVGLYNDLQRFLLDQHQEDMRTLLVVDEAQNLGTRSLEELRMLSNMNADGDQLLQLVLVGQPELKEKLRSPELRQLAQRVAADFHLQPLDPPEVQEYIARRLEIAGSEEELFTPEACERVAEVSQGIPRVINILCDTSLVYAFSDSSRSVSRETVDAVIADKSQYGIFDFNR